MDKFIAVDLGNSRIKFGLFAAADEEFPSPISVCADATHDFSLLEFWLTEQGIESETSIDWFLAWTGGTRYDPLRHWIRDHRPRDSVNDLVWEHVPMQLDIEFPERAGIDRLLAAFAAFAWRQQPENGNRFDPALPMLVVDAGTAITVDLVAEDGLFQGGAILPGLAAAADALARISPRLSKPDVDEIGFAVYPGRNTEEALAAGVYWGAVGAVRQYYELVAASLQLDKRIRRLPVLLTGGKGSILKNGLVLSLPEEILIEFPESVLVGIALVRRLSF